MRREVRGYDVLHLCGVAGVVTLSGLACANSAADTVSACLYADWSVPEALRPNERGDPLRDPAVIWSDSQSVVVGARSGARSHGVAPSSELVVHELDGDASPPLRVATEILNPLGVFDEGGVLQSNRVGSHTLHVGRDSRVSTNLQGPQQR